MTDRLWVCAGKSLDKIDKCFVYQIDKIDYRKLPVIPGLLGWQADLLFDWGRHFLQRFKKKNKERGR